MGAMLRNKFLIGSLIGVGLLAGMMSYGRQIVFGATSPQLSISENARTVSRKVDLLRSQSWHYMPGAQLHKGGLSVTNLGLTLYKQDGSYAEPNPPVNLYGNWLKVGNNFTIETSIRDLQGQGRLVLYGQVPTVLDEARYDAASLHLDLEAHKLHVGIKSGSSAHYVEEQTFPLIGKPVNTITISTSKQFIFIKVNGRKLAKLAAHDIFQSHRVWWGFDTSKSMVISRLAAYKNGDILKVMNAATLKVSNQPSDGLQQLVRQKRPGLQIGTAVSLEPLVADPNYAKRLASGWFGQITTENALKANVVHPQPNVYNYAAGDALVDFAQRHGLSIHGHTLIFGEAIPGWLQHKVSAPPAELTKIMNDHIGNIVKHYRGQINTWDVVNEPLDDSNQLRSSLWSKVLGEDYIRQAFLAARRANPDAKLFINENGLEGGLDDPNINRWDTFLNLIDRQLAQGTPIDGVGFQAHVDRPRDLINAQLLQQRMQELAKRHLLVRISEMDVSENDDVDQVQQFTAVFQSCLAQTNCVDFTTWGIGEGNGATAWLDDGQIDTSDSLLFDKLMRPRAPAQALKNLLQ